MAHPCAVVKLNFLARFNSKLAANVTAAGDFLLNTFLWSNEFKDEGADLTSVQLAPFGRFPNVQGMQVFGPADARSIASDFLSNVKMAVGLGLPWYVGHPDHPLHKDRYKDGAAYGRIKGLEARANESCSACKSYFANAQGEPCREHGLFAQVKFNAKGKTAIANEEFHGHSVNWRLKKVANEWHPFELKSVGFTNEPNIPVPAITAANEEAAPWLANKELEKAHWAKLARVRAGVLTAANGDVRAYRRVDPRTGKTIVVQPHHREGEAEASQHEKASQESKKTDEYSKSKAHLLSAKAFRSGDVEDHRAALRNWLEVEANYSDESKRLQFRKYAQAHKDKLYANEEAPDHAFEKRRQRLKALRKGSSHPPGAGAYVKPESPMLPGGGGTP